MRSSRVLWKNLALFLIALLVSLGICELLARSFIPVRNVGPSFTVYDPFYGKALKKNFSGRRITPEFTMKFTTNSDGFRGPPLETVSSRPLLFLGDSFTMGYGVNDGEEFPALVGKGLGERDSETVPVINAGMGHSGNGRWVKFLRSEGKKYDPRLVVLQIHANDFEDNVRERLFEQSPAGGLIELPIPPPGKMRILQILVDGVPGLSYSYLIGWGRQVSWPRNSTARNTDSESPVGNQDQTTLEEPLLYGLLEEVLEICEDQGREVLAVLADIPENRLGTMQEFFSERNVLTVMIPTKRDRPDLYYKVDGHWNASGHRFTADRILEAMEIFNE